MENLRQLKTHLLLQTFKNAYIIHFVAELQEYLEHSDVDEVLVRSSCVYCNISVCMLCKVLSK